jgi:adenine/guanine phosphoribosyltransferase-like PRPP-binding protein
MIYDCGTGGSNLDGLRGHVERAVKELKPVSDQFDSIVVQGMSGVTVGVPVSLALDKPLTILRKESEASHSKVGELINKKAIKPGDRVLFLDDFVGLGSTRGRCRFAVERVGGQLVGEYLYSVWALDTLPNQRTIELYFY